jgi:hypothetical protein
MYKIVATKLGVSESLVQAAVDHYYKEVRRNLSELTFINIHVLGLGTFKVKRKKITLIHEKYQRMLKKLSDSSSFKMVTIRKSVQERVDKFSNLFKMLDSESTRKFETRKRREEYYAKKDMAEQIPDTSRITE